MYSIENVAKAMNLFYLLYLNNVKFWKKKFILKMDFKKVWTSVTDALWK